MALIAVFLLMSYTSVWAFGIGVYGQYKSASTKMYVDYLDPDNIFTEWEEEPDGKRSLGGFGLLLDTSVSSDSIFNYRLQIGMGFGTLSIDGMNYNEDITLTEYHMYHSFGFGIVRNDSVRLWLGPQIGLGLASGTYSYPGSTDTEYKEYYASIGAILGLNVHLSESFSLGLSAGVRNNLAISGTDATADLFIDYSSIDGGLEMFGDVAVLLRFE